MKVEQTNETAEELRLHVTATPEDMDKAFADGLDVFVVQYHMEDAEGETAREKIVSALGETDASQAIYSAVLNHLVPFALEEFGVLPLATYGIQSDAEPEPGAPFEFDMTVLAKPEFELSDYTPLTVNVAACPSVTDADIEEQMGILVRQFAAAQQGKESNDPTVQVPKLTDAWTAENLAPMEISTVDELRERFRVTSEEELATRHEQAKMTAAIQAYAKRFKGRITKAMLAAMTQELYETFLAELSREGQTFEQFSEAQGMSEDDVRAKLSEQAEAQLIQGFILDAIFRHEGLVLDVSDLQAAVRNMAPGREDETLDALTKSGRLFLLKEAAARMKAAQWVMNNTTFVEE